MHGRPNETAPPGTGLKRHPALAPLSREHHHALVWARRLRLAGDETRRSPSAGAAVGDFLAYFRSEMGRHFTSEEEVLAPLLAGIGYEPVRLFADHEEIRRLVGRLESAALPADLLDTLTRLGTVLEAHVRYEERELFEYLQERLDPGALGAVARELADRGHDGPSCTNSPRT
jgi:iron-sulfur cluster repair protein YtfE (RIC family)